MMDRRIFLTTVASLLAAPLAADAQQAGKVHRVGVILTTSPVAEMSGPEPVHPLIRAFVHALRALGHVEGQNLILERRSAEGRFERFADIVAELVRLKADVIVTVGTPMTQRAKEVTTTVPIVMLGGFDPVRFGIVQSLARPGGNVTGFAFFIDPELHAKRLQLLKEALPQISRVAFLGLKSEWEGPVGQRLQAAAQALRLTLFLAEHTPTQYADAFSIVTRERPDALFVSSEASNYANRHLVVDFANRHRLPSMHGFRDSVELGGLMAYGADNADLYRRAAGYVDKILKGANPAHLPVEQPTKFELVINMKTAKALGLTIPPLLLMRADQVIE
jgi:putative tryptophan/tyrosine transport system substrate-binding protein